MPSPRASSASPASRKSPQGSTASRTQIEVGGRTLEVSNLEKVLYPQTGFTKGDLIDYYTRIGPVLLPHLKGRALTLKRYPDGVEGFFFYEKRCPPHRPDWVHTASVYSHGRGAMMDYCLADDLPSLIWAANLADIELHTNLARSRAQERPTVMVYDLDPGEGANIVNCAQVAIWLRDALRALSLESFIKTSGSKGLQLYVPLNTPVTFDDTKVFSKTLAQHIEAAHPNDVVTKMLKTLRRNKVLIDWSQNDQYKTTVCVYSLRAKAEPSVSMPLRWDEVEALLTKGDPDSVRFSPDAALRRVNEQGDLFAPVLTLKQKLPPPTALLDPASQVPTAEDVPSRTTSRARLSSRKPRKTG